MTVLTQALKKLQVRGECCDCGSWGERRTILEYKMMMLILWQGKFIPFRCRGKKKQPRTFNWNKAQVKTPDLFLIFWWGLTETILKSPGCQGCAGRGQTLTHASKSFLRKTSYILKFTYFLLPWQHTRHETREKPAQVSVNGHSLHRAAFTDIWVSRCSAELWTWSP